MRKKLTAQVVAGLKPSAKGRVEIWDTLLPGLGLRVLSTGKKVLIVATRRPGAKHPVRLKLGEHPPLVLVEARTKARALTAGGVALCASIQFRPFAEQFLQHGRTKKGRSVRQTTQATYRKILIRYVAELHQRPIAAITRREIAALISNIATKSDRLAGPQHARTTIRLRY
jgi:hypothetical protein